MDANGHGRHVVDADQRTIWRDVCVQPGRLAIGYHRRWLVRMVRGDGGSASSTLLVRVGVELVQKAEALLGFDLVGFAMRFVWSLLFSTIVGQTWRSS